MTRAGLTRRGNGADLDAILARGGPWKRAVRIGRQLLIEGDCRDVLAAVPRADAVVSDPPYGIGHSLGRGGKSKVWRGLDRDKNANRPIFGDDAPFDPAFLAEAADLLVLWGADHYASRLPCDGMFHVWDKDPKGRVSWDPFSDAEIVWTSWRRKREIFRYLWKGLCQQGGGERRDHPMQKPVPVMEWCLGFVPDARTILDPFMGSGTTLVACQRLARYGIGIEIDPAYFDIACRRVDEAARQPNLFDGPPPAPKQESLL